MSSMLGMVENSLRKKMTLLPGSDVFAGLTERQTSDSVMDVEKETAPYQAKRTWIDRPAPSTRDRPRLSRISTRPGLTALGISD